MLKLYQTFNRIKFQANLLSLFDQKFRFSSTKLPVRTSYPYSFGGLKNVPFQQNQMSFAALKQIFEQQTLLGFKQAYKYILQSVAQKDIKSLQSICQPNLVKNLVFKNVQLVNPDANIEVLAGKSFNAFGTSFIRDNNLELKQMREEQGNTFYLNLGLMKAPNPVQIMKYATSGVPFLQGYEVLFRSAMKLVPQGSRNSKTQPNLQIHSIQFQVQGKLNLGKYMNIAANMGTNMSFEEKKKILKQMVGENYEWKIGDIDRALNRNIKVI